MRHEQIIILFRFLSPVYYLHFELVCVCVLTSFYYLDCEDSFTCFALRKDEKSIKATTDSTKQNELHLERKRFP